MLGLPGSQHGLTACYAGEPSNHLGNFKNMPEPHLWGCPTELVRAGRRQWYSLNNPQWGGQREGQDADTLPLRGRHAGSVLPRAPHPGHKLEGGKAWLKGGPCHVGNQTGMHLPCRWGRGHCGSPSSIASQQSMFMRGPTLNRSLAPALRGMWPVPICPPHGRGHQGEGGARTGT